MFNACRIPAKPADYAIKLREDAPEGQHFIVIRNNKFYKLPLWDAEKGQKYSLETLEK
jgi:carnitine O-acetyltransferase